MFLSVYLFLVSQLIIVSYMDIKIKKVSNYWILFNGLLFVFCLFLFPNQYHFIFQTFILPIILLVFGFIFFKFGIMGAGDSKYLSSFYLLIPLSLQKEASIYCAYSIIAAGCLALIINTIKNTNNIIKAIKQSNISEIQGIYGNKIPFIPIVFLSWIWFGIDFWERMI